MASAQTTTAPPPLKPGLAGWLLLFVVRFYIDAFAAFAGAAKNHSKLYIAIGVIELILGLLLSIENRVGLILTRIWLMLEATVFGLLAALAFLPPTDNDAALKLLSYCLGSVILVVYFFRSKRVKLTYSRN
jgi:hypothetical protein